MMKSPKSLSRTKTTKNLGSQVQTVPQHGPKTEAIVFGATVFLAQCALLIIYGVWIDYETDVESVSNSLRIYGYFRDVNIMIFFGFGFLMTFLRRYGYSAIGYTLLISAMVAQWSVPLQGWFESIEEEFPEKFNIGIYELVNGLFCAGAVMISFGAVLGKVSPLQLVVMGILEPVFYWLNIYITIIVFKGVDVGGGMTIHTFGCYFGLTVCWFLTSVHTRQHKDNATCYSSDLFSYAGTLFLFIMWPSFNAAIARDSDGELRALVNTFISITASAITAFVVSSLVSEWKFEAVHIQNSTLAGGVAMGVAADLALTPTGAMGAGMTAGIISVLGYRYLTPILSKRFNIQDVCGIHNLHGMPGVLSCIIGIFGTLHGHSKPEKYGDMFNEYFPRGDEQAGWQTAGLFVTISLAICGGIVTGIVMRFVGRVVVIPHSDYYNDRTFWNLPSDYDYVIDKDGNNSDLPYLSPAPSVQNLNAPSSSSLVTPSPPPSAKKVQVQESSSTSSSSDSDTENDIEMQDTKKK